MARIIDIFSTEPLDACQQLLDAATQLVKSRKARNTPEPKRRQKVTVAGVTGETAGVQES